MDDFLSGNGDNDTSTGMDTIPVSNPYENGNISGGDDAYGGNNSVGNNNTEQDDFIVEDIEIKKKPNSGSTEQKQSEDQEPTVLSVWLESRNQILEEKRAKEKEEQEALQKQSKTDLQKFHDDRKRRIEDAKKQNRTKEQQLREDLQSVFEYGTVWEQVARMVNLQEATDKRGPSGDQERMRNLLIQLKNEKKPADKKTKQ